MSDGSDVRFRILAYIGIHYGAADYSVFPNGLVPRDHGLPSVFKGYVCDITLEVESVINGIGSVKIIDHYGDGNVRPTFQEARTFVLDTSGILLDEIPGRAEIPPPPTGEWGICVAQMVREFLPTTKPQEEVESDSLIKNLKPGNLDDQEFGLPITNAVQ